MAFAWWLAGEMQSGEATPQGKGRGGAVVPGGVVGDAEGADGGTGGGIGGLTAES